MFILSYKDTELNIFDIGQAIFTSEDYVQFMKKSKGMLQNAVILFAAMTITKIIGAILKIPLGNILGGLGMGYFSAAYSVFSPIYALTTAALPTVITKLVAENAASGKIRNIRKIKKLAVKVSMLLGFFGMIAIFVITTPFALYITSSPKSIPAMLMIAPSLFFCCVAAVYRGYYEGMCNMLPTAISQVVEAIVKSVLGIFLSYLVLEKTGSLPYAAAAAVFGITISEICGLIFLLIRSKAIGDGITDDDIDMSEPPESAWTLLKKVYTEMLPITIASVVINLSSLIDLLTITNTINYSINQNKAFFLENFTYGFSSSVNLEDLGNFIYGSYTGIVASLFGLVSSMTSMVSRSAIPNIAASFERKNNYDILKNIKIIFKGTFIIGFPLSFGMAAMAKPLLSLLYSSKPAEILICTTPLIILCVFGMSLSIASAIFNIFTAIGRSDYVIKLMLLGSIIKLLGNIILIQIPELNITGAAISTIICYTIICIIGIFILKRTLKLKLGIMKELSKSIPCSAVCGISAYLSYNYLLSDFDLSSAVKLLISVAIAAIVYLIMIMVTDFRYVKGFLNKQYK